MADFRVLELTEWEEAGFPDISLTDSDRAAWRNVEFPRIELREARQGIVVKATSWVGVVRLATLEIKVAPKLAGSYLNLARMLDYAHGLEAMQRLDGGVGISSAGDNLVDLLALLFVEAVERVVARGLISDYLSAEADLSVVRGRILVEQQVLRRFGMMDKVACRYDEYEPDVLENQIVLTAIHATTTRVASREVRRRLERLRHIFEPITDVCRFDSDSARSITYHRLNAHYQPAHQLAWLLFDGWGVSDLLEGRQESFAFFLDMNRLFERFVETWVRGLLARSPYRVRRQVRHDSVVWNVDQDASYSNLIPDLLVDCSASGYSTPLDAKYKRYEEGTGEADLYQAFLYAWALGTPAATRPRCSVLVHPVESEDIKVTRVRMRAATHSSEAEIIIFGVPISRAIAEANQLSKGPIGSALVKELIQGSSTGAALIPEAVLVR